jgi:preprotein translocase subunit SecD
MPDRKLTGLAPLMVVVLVTAGCGLSAVATPTPSPAAVSTPSPSPCLPHMTAEYRVLATAGQVATPSDMDVIRTILEKRLSEAAASPSVVQVASADRILIDFPAGLDETGLTTLRQLASRTGRLLFIPVPSGRADVTPGEAIPAELLTDPGPLFGGDQLANANATTDQAGRPALAFELKEQAKAQFAAYTTDHVGDQFAIVLDGIVQSAPSIRSPITDGKGIIEGSFARADVDALVTILKYGALPFDVEEVQFQPGPTCAV